MIKTYCAIVWTRKKPIFLIFFEERSFCADNLTKSGNFATNMTKIITKLKRLLVRLRRFRHRNGYGIHSPFAYNFVKGVVYESGNYYAYKSLSSRRRKRPKSERGLSAKADRMMFRLANFCHPGSVSLIGMRAALTAEYVAAAVRSAQVSIYPQPSQLPAQGLEFVFAARDTDFLTAYHITAQCATEATLFAAAGIHASKQNCAKWDEIRNNPRSIVTFDLYDVGIVFFNPKYNKQNYTINF